MPDSTDKREDILNAKDLADSLQESRDKAASCHVWFWLVLDAWWIVKYFEVSADTIDSTLSTNNLFLSTSLRLEIFSDVILKEIFFLL